MFLELDGDGALHQQLYRAMRAQILAGRLVSGTRLPSTRTLAASLGLSRNTVLLAYEQLIGEGYARSRPGARAMVSAELAADLPDGQARLPSSHRPRSVSPRLASAGKRMLALSRGRLLRWDLLPGPLPYDFRFGRPAFRDFPHAMWCRLLARRARRASVRDLDYGPPQGRQELRMAIADRLRRYRGIDASPERIVITNGTQQALNLVCSALIDPGDRVLIEEPHYLGARAAFVAAGARLMAAPVNQDGMTVSGIGATTRPRLAYVTPSHQYPTGVVMALARRLELLDWATRCNAFIVEDDYDSEYRYEGRPLQALAGLDTADSVVYVGTFSKLMFPALRLGYLLLPESLVEPIAAAKSTADTGNGSIQQLALADFIEQGHFERHMHRATTRNRLLRAVLLEAIAQNFGDRAEVSGANAGLHVLVWLTGRNGQPIRSIVEKARGVGVGLYPVAPYYLRPPRRTGVLLGYGPLREREIREGIRRLASVLG
jgi:GntR family transcriptional regulator / MocR family aminotransferase